MMITSSWILEDGMFRPAHEPFRRPRGGPPGGGDPRTTDMRRAEKKRARERKRYRERVSGEC
jgi:hypothetical protein